MESGQRARLADIENENRRQEVLAQQDAFSAQGLTRDNYRSFVAKTWTTTWTTHDSLQRSP